MVSTMHLTPANISLEFASLELFGVNFLANIDQVGDFGNSDILINELNAKGLRFPGGSITEHYFDLSNPNKSQITNLSGEVQKWMPLSNFISFAEKTFQPVTIVLPTQRSLSDMRDQFGERIPNIDEAELRSFVLSVISGRFGNAKIEAFEIGNEYWGAGQMSSIEYARLSSQMIEIISSEIERSSHLYSSAQKIDIIVQAGTNHGHSNLSNQYNNLYSSQEVLIQLEHRFGIDFPEEEFAGNGSVNWRLVNDEIIFRYFENSGNIDEIDGVVTHLYSQGQINSGHRDFGLNQVIATWGESNEALDFYVTEWNSSAKISALDRSEDYGLKQAHEMLNIVEVLIDKGVDNAHVWAMLHNTKTALSFGLEHSSLSVPGEMFRIMSDRISGKHIIDFSPFQENISELQQEAYDIHGFFKEGEIALFIVSKNASQEEINIDLSEIFSDVGLVTGELLGVEDGERPNDSRSRAFVEQVDGSAVISQNYLSVSLGPYEILALTFREFEANKKFADLIQNFQTYSEDYSIPRVLVGNGSDTSLVGESNDDVLIGGGVTAQLEGGAGNDLLFGGDPSQLSNQPGNTTFIGGEGEDTVSYEGSFGSLRVDLQFSNVNTFAAAGDTYHGIEHLTGSQGADNMRGDQGDNELRGAANVDYIFGRRGDDTLMGGVGDDVLLGGVGADVLIGGDDRDRAQYSASLEGLLVDLADATLNTGEAAGDIYDSIEDLAGSSFSDTLFGDDGDNRLFGRPGEDLLIGRFGNDTLNGGGGRDTLDGGAGNDVLRGGDSRDTFVFTGGADVVEDYALDILSFDRDLWGGADLDPAQIKNLYLGVSGGNTVFDFGGGDALILLGYIDSISISLIEDF